MKARIFRQIKESVKPLGTPMDMWLKPNARSFWLMVYKPESQEWVSLGTKTYWEEILEKPTYLLNEENLINFINENTINVQTADEVGFRYGGSVDAITSIEPTVTVEENGENLPSVDAVLEKIIRKLWWQDLSVGITTSPKYSYVKVARDTGDITFNWKISNYIKSESSTVNCIKSSTDITVTGTEGLANVDGDATGTITIPSFKPTAYKDYTVKIQAVCEDADGNVKGQNKSDTYSVCARFPYFAGTTLDFLYTIYNIDPSTGEPDDSDITEEIGDMGKIFFLRFPMLTGSTATFKFAKGTNSYQMIIPSIYEVTEITQGLKGDWNGFFTKSSDVLNGYEYTMYNSSDLTNSGTDEPTVTVTLKKIG